MRTFRGIQVLMIYVCNLGFWIDWKGDPADMETLLRRWIFECTKHCWVFRKKRLHIRRLTGGHESVSKADYPTDHIARISSWLGPKVLRWAAIRVWIQNFNLELKDSFEYVVDSEWGWSQEFLFRFFLSNLYYLRLSDWPRKQESSILTCQWV